MITAQLLRSKRNELLIAALYWTNVARICGMELIKPTKNAVALHGIVYEDGLRHNVYSNEHEVQIRTQIWDGGPDTGKFTSSKETLSSLGLIEEEIDVHAVVVWHNGWFDITKGVATFARVLEMSNHDALDKAAEIRSAGCAVVFEGDRSSCEKIASNLFLCSGLDARLC